MQLGAAYFLVLLVLVPVLALLYLWGFRRRRRALAGFVARGLAARLVGAHSWRRRGVKAAFLVAAVGLLAVAVTEPQWGRDVGDNARRGRDIYILLDVSQSMLAEDTAPSRLDAAKAAIVDFVDELRAVGGNRLGLVAFAGRASLQCPLTLDYAFFLNRLHQVTTSSVERQGSAIGDAIRKTLYGFGALDAAHTDFIIISDGEDHGSLVLDAAKTAADEGVAVYTVGVGDPAQGARIPLVTAEGARAYLRFAGEDVVSVMQEPLLMQIARASKGAYLRARTGPIELNKIFVEHIAGKAQRELETTEGERLADRYYWFVIVALALLAGEMLIGERPRARAQMEG
jgi:Ca-activated chloride channel family protein